MMVNSQLKTLIEKFNEKSSKLIIRKTNKNRAIPRCPNPEKNTREAKLGPQPSRDKDIKPSKPQNSTIKTEDSNGPKQALKKEEEYEVKSSGLAKIKKREKNPTGRKLKLWWKTEMEH